MADILEGLWRLFSGIQDVITVCVAGILLLSVIAVYFLIKLRIKPKIEETSFLHYRIYAYYGDIQDITTEIINDGFEPLGDYFVQQMGKTFILVRYFIDSKGHTSALIELAMREDHTANNLILEMETDFEDGTRVNSTNKTARSIFKRDRKQHEFQYPQCPPAKLIKFHRENIEGIGNGRIPKTSPREISEYIERDIKREMDLQILSGLMKIDSTGQYCKPTAWGAFIMTYKLWLQMFYKVLPLKRTRKMLGTYQKDKRFF